MKTTNSQNKLIESIGFAKTADIFSQVSREWFLEGLLSETERILGYKSDKVQTKKLSISNYADISLLESILEKEQIKEMFSEIGVYNVELGKLVAHEMKVSAQKVSTNDEDIIALRLAEFQETFETENYDMLDFHRKFNITLSMGE